MAKTKKTLYWLSDKERILVYRRVLRMVDGYLAKLPQDTLTTNGKRLYTWGEIRLHVQGALAIRSLKP